MKIIRKVKGQSMNKMWSKGRGFFRPPAVNKTRL